MANVFKAEDDESTNGSNNYYHKWTELDYTRTPDKLLKEESGSNGWFSAITGKGLALSTNLASEAEIGSSNGFQVYRIKTQMAAYLFGQQMLYLSALHRM
ncbi:hypothetical protein RND81_07G160800 [Saponaria officinalis]|uniref:Uncharacterized protein n=1 Tax=Saponaria officinalis TaxID=3572 RepID=A0AAW1JSL2_SAPOF